jgi:hypothetical protein
MKAAIALIAGLALSSSAQAGTKTVSIGLDGFCDVLVMKITGYSVFGTDACESGVGVGFLGGAKGFGPALLGSLVFTKAAGSPFFIRISRPLVTGGKWDMYYSPDGVTMAGWWSGTYTVETGPANGPRGGKSVLAAGPRPGPELKP